MAYAPHLGFPGLDAPWFLASAGLDPVVQIERAAQEGFTQVCDNNLLQRPPREVATIAQALARSRIGFSSYVAHGTQTPWRWNDDRAEALADIRERLSRALEVGQQVGAHFMTVVAINDQTPVEEQARRMAANLAWAGPIARAAGITLALEPVNPARLPGVLVTEVGLAAQILEATGSSDGSCLLFDIEHVRFGNGDLITARDRVAHLVGLVQITGHDRAEPGAGAAPIVPFLRHIRARGYRGTIELEHRHTLPGLAGERASLALLRAIDAQVSR